MIYNNFQGIKLSALGLGCMRLPVQGDDFNQIDVEATREMIAYAFEKGINYFDTAWGYHDGNSETVIGEILKSYPRDSFYLATKFPGYELANMGKVEEIFEEQLKKCQVDYFDFYLFHNVCELNIDGYLDPQYDILEYLLEQKRNGRIRHLGFSSHGTLATMKHFLDAYGEHMEFCMIQLNWLDWKMQNAKGKVELLKEYGLPVWVMEPVRGGKLSGLEPEYEERLKAARPDATVVEWAFRFVQSIPEVKMTLSGMSNLEQLKENIATYEAENALNNEEKDTLLQVATAMTSKDTLPCTACRYCTTHCPMELNIPDLIDLYNEHVYSGGGFLAPMAIGALPDDKKPSACIGCRACEAVCPQNIKISEMMSDFVERLK
ncbi:MAG: aldo/keto reductase [Lachnospiraceae bacterium]|nr:aldo/keto reductase [Lachnospiraceae bacterium]